MDAIFFSFSVISAPLGGTMISSIQTLDAG